MAAPVGLLRRVTLFAGLDEAALTELAKLCQQRTFGQGSPVTTAGSRAAGFFIVADGEATVRVHGVVRKRLRRGDTFGALAVIDGGRRMADITAETDLQCYAIPERAFKTFVTGHPDVAWALLVQVVGMVREYQEREAPRKSARQRIALRRRAKHSA